MTNIYEQDTGGSYHGNYTNRPPDGIDFPEEMSPENFAQTMEQFYDKKHDLYEANRHHHMDMLMAHTLKKLGYGDGVDIFLKAGKWYA